MASVRPTSVNGSVNGSVIDLVDYSVNDSVGYSVNDLKNQQND
jgi:hypothetical protein